MIMKNRVYVTGMGCVSALGNNVETAWQKAISGQTGIRYKMVRKRYENVPPYSSAVAEVKLPDTTSLETHLGLDARSISRLDPISLFALIAAKEALNDANLKPHSRELEETSILMGVSVGGLTTIEDSYQRVFVEGARTSHPLTVPKLMPSAPPSNISILFGVKGLTYSIASACASSSHAMMEAYYLIKTGRADRVIVGGSDAQLTYLSWLSWKSLGAISKDTCRPFCATRSGLVMGEGAAMLVFESDVSAMSRGVKPYGEILGTGATSDAYHITKPQGDMALKAIEQAHHQADIPVNTPLLINAHGTGTILNDRVEALVMQEHYNHCLSQNAVIATKSAHGHMIGATAAMEMIMGLQSLNTRQAPPILNYQESDTRFDIPLVLGPLEDIDYEYMLSNCFAFGGLNSSLLVKRMR